MNREEQEPVVDERGDERHPAFGVVSINRVSSSHGASLFDSEIRHQHYIVLTISTATRERELQRDWIHDDKQLIEIAVSESQWARMVSSLNSGSTPCTIEWQRGTGYTPRIPHAPRLALSIAETRDAARRMFARAKEALELVKERPTKANIRSLEHALNGAEPNVTFASESLAAHAENTVQKAKADIEALVNDRARQLGIDPHMLTIELREQDEPKEIES